MTESSAAFAHEQVPAQSAVQGFVGVDQYLMCAGFGCCDFQGGDVALEALCIALAQVLWRDADRALGLHVFKYHRFAPVRIALLRIQQLKQNDVMPAISKRLHRFTHRFRIAVQIGDDNDETAALQVFSKPLKATDEVRRVACLH